MDSGTHTGTPMRSGHKRKRGRANIEITFFLGAQISIGRSQPYTLPQAGAGDIDGANHRFVAILDDLRVEVEKQGEQLKPIKGNYLERLRETGAAAYQSLLPKQAREYLQTKEEEYRERGLSLTFLDYSQSAYSMLFWEMMYTGDTLSDVKDNDQLLDQFWGFHYPLGRILPLENIEPTDEIRFQAGIYSAIHDELPFARKEVEKVAEQIKAVCQRLRSNNLTLQLLDCDQRIPIASLSTNELIKLLVSDEFRYGVVHFACHCESPENAESGQSYLSLTMQGRSLQITLEKILGLQSEYRFRHRPLFFLNACKSVAPGYLLQKLNFPIGILKLQAGGVIATACIIPDNFASAFATRFYEELLNANAATSTAGPDGALHQASLSTSTDIGEALRRTRLYFAKEYNNPLGLAYGLYAVSNQQLLLDD